MTTSALQERRKRLVNRVGRHLPCNSMQVVSDFAKVAAKASEDEQAIGARSIALTRLYSKGLNQQHRCLIHRLLQLLHHASTATASRGPCHARPSVDIDIAGAAAAALAAAAA